MRKTYHDVLGIKMVSGELAVERVDELHGFSHVGGNLKSTACVQNDSAVFVKNLTRDERDVIRS